MQKLKKFVRKERARTTGAYIEGTWSPIGFGVTTEGISGELNGWHKLFKGSLLIDKKDLCSFLSFYQFSLGALCPAGVILLQCVSVAPVIFHTVGTFKFTRTGLCQLPSLSQCQPTVFTPPLGYMGRASYGPRRTLPRSLKLSNPLWWILFVFKHKF